jgi:hypothetical protein
LQPLWGFSQRSRLQRDCHERFLYGVNGARGVDCWVILHSSIIMQPLFSKNGNAQTSICLWLTDPQPRLNFVKWVRSPLIKLKYSINATFMNKKLCIFMCLRESHRNFIKAKSKVILLCYPSKKVKHMDYCKLWSGCWRFVWIMVFFSRCQSICKFFQ